MSEWTQFYGSPLWRLVGGRDLAQHHWVVFTNSWAEFLFLVWGQTTFLQGSWIYKAVHTVGFTALNVHLLTSPLLCHSFISIREGQVLPVQTSCVFRYIEFCVQNTTWLTVLCYTCDLWPSINHANFTIAFRQFKHFPTGLTFLFAGPMTAQWCATVNSPPVELHILLIFEFELLQQTVKCFPVNAHNYFIS